MEIMATAPSDRGALATRRRCSDGADNTRMQIDPVRDIIVVVTSALMGLCDDPSTPRP